VVLLQSFSEKLKLLDFEQITIFFQDMPTTQFTIVEVQSLLSKAYVCKSLYQNSPNHLNGPKAVVPSVADPSRVDALFDSVHGDGL
jgi:hypothetical protein